MPRVGAAPRADLVVQVSLSSARAVTIIERTGGLQGGSVSSNSILFATLVSSWPAGMWASWQGGDAFAGWDENPIGEPSGEQAMPKAAGEARSGAQPIPSSSPL